MTDLAHMGLDFLVASAGVWNGGSTLRDPGSGLDEHCASIMTVAPAVASRFVRLDYTWSYKGAPQEGTLLVGVDPGTGRCTASWADSWHLGYRIMLCDGEAHDGTYTVRGSYEAPPGPDWGWRIDITAKGGDNLRLTMHNVSPEGAEELAVEARYERTGSAPAAGRPETETAAAEVP